MNEKFNKNAKVEQLTKMFLSREEEKALSLKILWTMHEESNKAYWFETMVRYFTFLVSCFTRHGPALNMFNSVTRLEIHFIIIKKSESCTKAIKFINSPLTPVVFPHSHIVQISSFVPEICTCIPFVLPEDIAIHIRTEIDAIFIIEYIFRALHVDFQQVQNT